MNLADEVMTSLRSTRTVFVCSGGGAGHCGGALWHIDGDTEGRLTCDRCNCYMVLGTTMPIRSGQSYLPRPLSSYQLPFGEP